MHLLIAGGTGNSGRVLTERAVDAGHQVRVLTREAGRPGTDGHHKVHRVQGDLASGAGVDEAVDGVDAVVDLSNINTARYKTASAFFAAGTDHLFAAERRAGVGHHVTLSIVGVDRFPSAYYRAKLDQETAVIAASTRTGVGHSIARVTQFHDFAVTALQRFRIGRLVLAPPLHIQPVHLGDVADHLLGLLDDGPVGYAKELAGPQPEELPDMVRRYAQAIQVDATVLPVPLSGALRRANQHDVLRPIGGVRGASSFTRWLTEVQTCPLHTNPA